MARSIFPQGSSADTGDAYTPGGTDVAVADGGTGASTAEGARANLGAAAADADLTSFGSGEAADGQVATADGAGGVTWEDPAESLPDAAADLMLYTSDVNTWGTTSLTEAARNLLDDASVAAMRATLELVPGTNVAGLSSGRVPMAQLASGTPDGSKFIRDDGTLAVPSSAPAPAPVEEDTASKTLALTDAATFRQADSGVAIVYTIPPQSSVAWEDDTEIAIVRYGTGTVSVEADSGVTLRVPGGTVAACRDQYSSVMLKRLAEDEWLITGDLELEA